MINRIVRYNTVQEQAASPWSSRTASVAIEVAHSSAQAQFRYTAWSLLAGNGTHFSRGGGPTGFRDCQFAGGQFHSFEGLLGLTNCLWERVAGDLHVDDGGQVFAYNNLFRGGSWFFDNETEYEWVVKDNLFDTVLLSRDDGTITHGNNGYIGTTHLPGSSSGDVDITPPADYQQGPLGSYSYPTSGPKLAQLIDAGSRTAVEAGLACATTRVDHQPDEGQVDIGFHYRFSGGPPTASGPATFWTCGGQDVQVDLTRLVCPQNGCPLEWVMVSGPTQGRVLGTLPVVIYRPNPGATGTDRFTWAVSDGQQASAVAEVVINIDFQPMVENQVRVTHSSCPISISLRAEGCGPLTFSVESQPTLGTLCGIPPNLTYDPGAAGMDSFLFKVSDGVRQAYGNVSIEVRADGSDFWTDQRSPEELAVLLSAPGETVANVRYTGAAQARGVFGGGLAAGLPFESGIILSSGDIQLAAGPNDTSSAGVGHGNLGDAGLDALLDALECQTGTQDTHDAAVLEFDLTPTSDLLQFDLVFASEEYPEFVSNLKNDAVAIFVNCQNVAWVPGTSDPVCIFTVNANRNREYFQCNRYECSQTFDFEYDGFTSTPANRWLTASAAVQAGVPTRVKIVIADGDDDVYDSAVFIRARRPLACAAPCP